MEGINVILKNKEGEIKNVFFSNEEIWERIDCFAYDKLCVPECNSSTCAVNNFCECDPINDDFEYLTIEPSN